MSAFSRRWPTSDHREPFTHSLPLIDLGWEDHAAHRLLLQNNPHLMSLVFTFNVLLIDVSS